MLIRSLHGCKPEEQTQTLFSKQHHSALLPNLQPNQIPSQISPLFLMTNTPSAEVCFLTGRDSPPFSIRAGWSQGWGCWLSTWTEGHREMKLAERHHQQKRRSPNCPLADQPPDSDHENQGRIALNTNTRWKWANLFPFPQHVRKSKIPLGINNRTGTIPLSMKNFTKYQPWRRSCKAVVTYRALMIHHRCKWPPVVISSASSIIRRLPTVISVRKLVNHNATNM